MKFRAFILLVLLAGCGQQSDDTVTMEMKAPPVDTIIAMAGENDPKLPKVLAKNGGDLLLNLKMDSTENHLMIPLQIKSGDSIIAELSSSDKNANIRVSQIKMPDGKMDGPFGRTLQYPLKDTGAYQLIIGENMMAGDPWTGEFVLKLSVK